MAGENINNIINGLSNIELEFLNDDGQGQRFSESKRLIDLLISEKSEFNTKYKDNLADLEEICQVAEKNSRQQKRENIESYQVKVKSLRNDKLVHEKKLKKESLVLEEINNKKQFVMQKQNQLKEKEEVVSHKEVDEIVRDQATFALLSSTFSIKWDYSCPKNEVKGCITGKKDLTPFSVNKDQHSKTYTADYLWDLIELSQ